jgi:hypothetical protein
VLAVVVVAIFGGAALALRRSKPPQTAKPRKSKPKQTRAEARKAKKRKPS